jgi:molecular chaperone GrpE (heat shock protein)
MHTPDTHVQAPSEAENAHMTYQVQQRLLHLDAQIAHMHAQVERLMADTTEANSQVTVLVRHLTDPHPLQAVHERLAELGGQVEAHREQLDLLTRKLAELAGREQLAELANTITRLGRTQFKSNTLGETNAQQLERSLVTLQDLVTQREQLQSQWEHRRQEQFEEVRQEARGELAAELLPALDSVELALASGQALVHQQRHRVLRQGYRQHQRVLRYAEVVVARAAAGQPTAQSEPQEGHNE